MEFKVIVLAYLNIQKFTANSVYLKQMPSHFMIQDILAPKLSHPVWFATFKDYIWLNFIVTFKNFEELIYDPCITTKKSHKSYMS